MLTFFYFIFLFFLEGLSLLKKETILFFTLFLPTVFFFENSIQRKKIILPAKAILLYLIFLLISLIFSPFFVDKIKYVYKFFYYLEGCFLFILGVNEKKRLTKYLPITLILIGIIFSLSTFYFTSHPPDTALQFVYPSFPNHNHLGDFLGLPLLIILLFNFPIKLKLFLSIFFGCFFIFSFSRSAYIALIFSLSVFLIINRKKIAILPKLSFVFLLLLIIFFALTQKDVYQISFFKPVENFLINQLGYQPRSIFSNRHQYFSQAIKGFLEKPLTGWGLGNFIYISHKYALHPDDFILSAFNLFLTILSEGGFFAFLFFFGFFLLVLKRSNHQSYSFYLFLYQTTNFLADYTYSIYTFFLFWFLIAGISYQEESKKLPEIIYPILSYFSLFFIIFYLTSQIFLLTGQYQKSLIFFPYQHQGYQMLINDYLKNNEIYQAELTAKKYFQQTSFYSFETTEFLTDLFVKIGKEEEAIKGLRFYLQNNRFPSFDFAKKYYLLMKKNGFQRRANKEFAEIFNNLKTTFWFNQAFADEVYRFCFAENIPACRFRRFYIPHPNTKEKTEKSFPYQATYTFNNDRLNERFNYAKKKPKDVFRVAVLGGAEAFGFLINTKDNWVEKLEDKLNRQKNNKRYEVLNFAYHSYDLGYQAQRFLTQAKDYQPDMIIWLNNNFYRLNEVFLPITEEKEALIKLNNEKEKYQKQGIYFPSWQLAYEEYEKKIKQLGINVEQKQIEYLDEVFSLYKGPIIFISFYKPPEKIKTVLEENTCYLYQPEFVEPEYQFAKTGGLNYLSQQKLAETIFDFINNNDLSLCLSSHYKGRTL